MHILALTFTVFIPKKIIILWHDNISLQSLSNVYIRNYAEGIWIIRINIKSITINEIKIDVSIQLEEITCLSQLKRSASDKYTLQDLLCCILIIITILSVDWPWTSHSHPFWRMQVLSHWLWGEERCWNRDFSRYRFSFAYMFYFLCAHGQN